MPFRPDTGPCLISRSAVFLRLPPGLRVHAFSSSARLSAESREKTLYEVLGVPVSATSGEIKKRFYALSREHHPDKNPDDPSAHKRYSSMSSAYHVLSHNGRRAQYDRDNHIPRTASTTSSSMPSQSHRGSYAGSRPPSGLSRRRGPFRGPPPSFYAHGGYGQTGYTANARQNQQHQHQHQHQHQQQQQQQQTASDPNAFIYHNPVPHFDASAHFRTQTQEDARRRLRRLRALEHAKMQARARGLEVDEDTSSSTARFFAVMGLVLVGMMGISLGRAVDAVPSSGSAGRGTSTGTASRSGSATNSSRSGSGAHRTGVKEAPVEQTTA